MRGGRAGGARRLAVHGVPAAAGHRPHRTPSTAPSTRRRSTARGRRPAPTCHRAARTATSRSTTSWTVVCERRDTGRVTIDVNRDPAAGAVAVTMRPGEVRTIVGRELATDDEPLTITSLGGAPPGCRSAAAASSCARAAQDASFSVTVTDPGGLSARASVTVHVANAAGGQRRPGRRQRRARSRSTCWTTTATPTVTTSASSRCRPRRRSTGAGVASIGRTGGRSVRLSPTGGADGTATFSYTIVDEGGRESNAATVTVSARRTSRRWPPTSRRRRPPAYRCWWRCPRRSRR